MNERVDEDGISPAERAQLEKDGWIASQSEIDALFAQAEKQERVRTEGVRASRPSAGGGSGALAGHGTFKRDAMAGADPADVAELERVRGEAGLPLQVRREGEYKQLVARVSMDAWYGLKELAEAYGYMHGGSGNISALIEQIGQGRLRVVKSEDE